MAESVREFISSIQTSIRAVNSDSYVPPRYILAEGRSIIADFTRKSNDANKKLSRVMAGWSEIDCIQMEEIDVISCSDIDIRLCDKVMRSTQRLPDSFTYTYGNIIKHVASINFSFFFTPTTPQQWNNIQKRQYKDKNKYYYYIIDNYLYIPVPKGTDLPIEIVRMEAYFIDKWEVENFKLLKECGDCKQVDNCTSPLDYELVIPPYLTNDVKKELLRRLFETYLRLPVDDYNNLNSTDKINQRDLQNYEAP